MLLLVVLAAMVVTAMATPPMEEISTQGTSAEMEALHLVTMAMVALEAMPLAVSMVTNHYCLS